MATLRSRLFLLVLIFLFAISGFAAVSNAVLYGTVYDMTGKPLPGITIVLENPTLGLTRVTITAADGSYTIAEIPPAEGFRITARRAGQVMDVRDGVTVNVGDERLILPPLREQQPQGAIAEPVVRTVAKAVANETVTPSISGVITRDQLRSLPLYNRNFLALGLLTANTHDVEAGSALAGASFSVAGARPSSNLFLLDGSDNVASSSNQPIPFQVNEAIQEFRVTSALAPAEFGRNSGGVVNVVTQRGSNAFHGAMFGYFANDALNASSPVSVYNGSGFDQSAHWAGPTNLTPVDPNTLPMGLSPVSYNNYVNYAHSMGWCTNSIQKTSAPGLRSCNDIWGVSSGGYGKNTFFDPGAVLSKYDRFDHPFDSKQLGVNLGGALRKDKVFAFGSYEATLIENPNPIFERVPSKFDRTYDPLGSAGVTGSWAAPYFRSNDPNFVLAQDVIALYPSPNVVGVPGVLEFYRGQAPNYNHVHNFLGRADVVQSDKSNWSFRYSAQVLNQLHDDTLPVKPEYPGNGAVRDALNQNLTGVYTHSFSSHVSNEERIGFTRFRVTETPQDASIDPSTLGLPAGPMMTWMLSGLDTAYSGGSPLSWGAYTGWSESLWAFGKTLFMNPTLDGMFPFARIGAPMNAPGRRMDSTLSINDNLSWSLAKHALKFGGEFRVLNNEFSNGAFARGTVVSGDIGEFVRDSETCGILCYDSPPYDVQSYRAPSFDYALRQSSPYAGTFHSFAVAGYAHDTWRVLPRLTISAGLRYEYFSPPQEQNHAIWNFDPAANGLVRDGTSQVVDPWGQPCGKLHRWNVVHTGIHPLDEQWVAATPWNCQANGSGKMATPDRNNFAPRVGLAFDIFGNGRSVLRFGAGWYFDQLPMSYPAQLLFNRPTPLSLTSPELIYGQNFVSMYPFPSVWGDNATVLCFQCGIGNSTLNPATMKALGTAKYQAAASPFAMSAFDPAHSESPYSRQFAATFQQSIGSQLALEAGYIGTFGIGLPVVSNTNFNNEWRCKTYMFETSSVPGCDHLGPVFTMANRAESNYHSGMLRVRTEAWHGLRLNATYNWSRSYDNASNSIFPFVPITVTNLVAGLQLFANGNPAFQCRPGTATAWCASRQAGASSGAISGSDMMAAGLTTTGSADVLVTRYSLPQDPVNFLNDDYGRSDFDSRHRAVLDFTWQVPRPRSWRGLLDHWMLSGVFIAQSGQPFTVFSGPVGGELTQRANITGPVTITGDPKRYIETSGFELGSKPCGLDILPTPDKPLCLGNSRRNGFTGPSYITTDFAVQKAILVRESRSVTLRAEVYNLFNRANYYNPISTLSTDGALVNPEFGRIKSAHNPRQIQFALRFNW